MPPTWTVPARGLHSSDHGIGPSRAQSTLKTAGPAFKPDSRRRSQGDPAPTDADRRPGHHVEDHRVVGGKLVERVDLASGLDGPAAVEDDPGQGLGDALRATTDHRPAIGVSGDPEEQRDSTGER